MNLEEIRFRAREHADLVLSESDTTPADLDAYINSAYRTVLGAHAWPFLRQTLVIQTAVGAADYDAAPATAGDVVRQVRGVLLREPDDYRRLRPRPLQAFDSVGTPEHGTPREYAVLDRKAIRLYPVPDAGHEILVEATVTPAKLVADTDVPVFGEDYHEMLALAAGSRVLRRRRADGDVGRANDLDAGVDTYLRRMKYEELADHDPTPAVHGGRRGGRGRL